MIAHDDVLRRWTEVPTAWPHDTTTLAVVALCAAIAVGDVARRPVHRHTRATTVAVLGLLVALASPLEPLADQLFAAHMLQHLVLVLVVAPAIERSHPWGSWRAHSPSTLRRAWMTSTRALHGLESAGGSPSCAAGAAVAALFLWHARVPYESAVTHPAVHLAEHATLVATWAWAWHTVRRAEARGRGPVALAALAFMSMAGNLLGTLLAVAPNVWYSVHPDTGLLRLDALTDQRLAGVLMAVGSSIPLLVVMAAVLLRWLEHERVGGADNASSR